MTSERFPGRVFAVVGPSGVGKDTVMQAVQQHQPRTVLVRRVITRPSEAGGEDFEGVSPTEFTERKARGEFVLHWNAHGLSYGIPASMTRHLQQGCPVLFNASRTILRDAALTFPELEVLHITAEASALAARLKARGRESETDIAQRLARSQVALTAGLKVTEIDNSGPLDATVAKVLKAISGPTPQKTEPIFPELADRAPSC